MKRPGGARSLESARIVRRLWLAAVAVSSFASTYPVAALGETVPEKAGRELLVFVSILPQRTFVERIAGTRARVEVMVPAGRSPHTYEPTPRQVTLLGKADVFFTIGVQFEKAFMPIIRRNLPDLQVVDSTAKIERIPMAGGHHHEDADHDHSAGEPDPHVWMSPVLVKSQGQVIADALSRIDPEGADLYASGYRSLEAELDALHLELTKSLAPIRGKELFVYHPAFGYFAAEYGLVQEAVETGGKEPAPAQIRSLIRKAKASGAKVILVQPEFPAKAAHVVASAIGGTVVTIAPLDADYFGSMRRIAREVAKTIH